MVQEELVDDAGIQPWQGPYRLLVNADLVEALNLDIAATPSRTYLLRNEIQTSPGRVRHPRPAGSGIKTADRSRLGP